MSRIAFYAPIKPPDHAEPSGDRLIAQNLIKALTGAGHDVKLASRYIAYSKREAEEILQQRKAGALAEAETIIGQFKNNPPDLWITYHPYCKAPDWIGPAVSRAFNIPYLTVEAAKTGQGFEAGGDRWAKWRMEAQQQMCLADHHLAFKPTDREFLTGLLGSDENISDIPPFLDTTWNTMQQTDADAALPEVSYPAHWQTDDPVMVAVGMMRPGKKFTNFKILADALQPLNSLPWNLVIVGGGPEEKKVRELFSQFDNGNRVLFTGRLPHEDVLAHMTKADLFVWPGWKEPIGMVYLEAQLAGLPVAALNSMGTPLTIRHGETGLLAPENDLAVFTDNLHRLLSRPDLRSKFGNNAKSHVLKRHSLQSAANVLRQTITPFLPSQ